MNPIIRTNNPNNPENSASDVFDDEIDAVDTPPESGPFQPFVPLKPRVDDLPAFPVDALPPRLSCYVKAVAEHTQTPVDMAAGVALGVLATCLQGKVRVEGNIDRVIPLEYSFLLRYVPLHHLHHNPIFRKTYQLYVC